MGNGQNCHQGLAQNQGSSSKKGQALSAATVTVPVGSGTGPWLLEGGARTVGSTVVFGGRQGQEAVPVATDTVGSVAVVWLEQGRRRFHSLSSWLAFPQHAYLAK